MVIPHLCKFVIAQKKQQSETFFTNHKLTNSAAIYAIALLLCIAP